MEAMIKKSILDVPLSQWPDEIEKLGEKSFRAQQIVEWIFKKRVNKFSEMSNVGQAFRDKLDAAFDIQQLEIDAVNTSPIDGTKRFFFKTKDGEAVSCVFLPFEGRRSLCLSSQVGCAWGCKFCASGLVKFQRNLRPSEILDQIFLVEKTTGEKIDSLLFMGMGEPLANFDSLVHSLDMIRSPLGLGYGSKHVTVSTCGLVPQIEKLAEVAPKVNLAISLHASRDDLRKELLPQASKWTIKQLMNAVKIYSIRKTAMVTFEYIVIDGVNDSDQDIKRLANLIRGPAQHGDYWINLIAYNPVPGLKYKAPKPERIEKIKEILKMRHIPVRLRKPQGSDIGAGCGQLGEPVNG